MPIDDSQLADFYNNARLGDEQAAAILTTGQYAAAARKWRRIAAATSLGMVCVIVLAGWLYVRGEQFRQMVIQERPSPEIESPPDEQQPSPPLRMRDEPSPEIDTPRFQFVAFRSHDDNCPHCRATGEMYAELKSRMQDAPIEFEAFELQNAAKREQTLTRIEARNLTPLVAGREETAFAVLLSPSGNSLKRFVPSDGTERVKAEISAIVDQ